MRMFWGKGEGQNAYVLDGGKHMTVNKDFSVPLCIADSAVFYVNSIQFLIEKFSFEVLVYPLLWCIWTDSEQSLFLATLVQCLSKDNQID